MYIWNTQEPHAYKNIRPIAVEISYAIVADRMRGWAQILSKTGVLINP